MNRLEKIIVRHWIVGTALAFCGVVLARVVAPSLAGRPVVVLTVTGQLLALAGLLIIALGVRRRVRSAGGSPEQDSAS